MVVEGNGTGPPTTPSWGLNASFRLMSRTSRCTYPPPPMSKLRSRVILKGDAHC